jgi:hypothetical protein
VPLVVTAAKYDETDDAVILKVKLPDGKDALTVGIAHDVIYNGQPLMERIAGHLLLGVPKTLTAQEIVSIKNHSIFRGMSDDALYYSLGYPESENDWGRGGKQFIYSHTWMVYLNNRDRVVDWQSLGN